MEYQVKVSNSAKQKSACLVFGVYESGQLSASAQQFDQAHAGHLSRLLKNSGMNGKLEQDRLLLDIPDSKADRVLLIGCGKADTIDDARYRKILSHTAQALTRTGAKDAVLYLNQLQIKERSESWRIRLASEIISASGYRFTEMKSKPNDENGLPAKITFAVADRKGLAAAQQALREGQAVAAGVALARDLGNLPGNICTPSYLAKQAKILAADYKTIKVKVLREAEMEKLGMGALLSVSKGSDQPARLIQMEYRNAPAKQAPVVLVGKGITFDTGGISIKPAGAMDEMKFDMCGAASVFGTIRACAELELPLNVIGLVAASENMPGGRASKPGDIVKTLSGQTVEILNTDAEGRLVLCDAVSYSERFKPDVVIDIATLTGACVVALGKHPHGLFSNHQALADALLAAGNNTVDRAWQLPLWEDYQEQLDSNFADMANIGGREGGAITAACFLSRFAKNLHWAHLDIAGTAWLSGKQKGATGRPVPLLTQFLLDRAVQE